MGHSKNRGRRRLTLTLPLKAKMIGLAMFVGGFMGLITSAQLDPISAHVERVIDGDTIHVRFEGKRYTVRLIGVDTPETVHPTKAVQYFGREASAFTKAALEGIMSCNSQHHPETRCQGHAYVGLGDCEPVSRQ